MKTIQFKACYTMIASGVYEETTLTITVNQNETWERIEEIQRAAVFEWIRGRIHIEMERPNKITAHLPQIAPKD